MQADLLMLVRCHKQRNMIILVMVVKGALPDRTGTSD